MLNAVLSLARVSFCFFLSEGLWFSLILGRGGRRSSGYRRDRGRVSDSFRYFSSKIVYVFVGLVVLFFDIYF